MKFTGLLVKESLRNDDVLMLVQVRKTETWNVGNATSSQPKAWTAMWFEGEESQADAVAEKLSHSLNLGHWYIDLSTASHKYVVFPNRVFKYTLGDKAGRAEAQQHGRSLGIPESQLDWGE